MSHGLTVNVAWWAERGSQGAVPSVPRTVFFVSDSTGITAETLGNALLADFPSARLERHTVPFFSSNATADAVVARLRRAAAAGYAPIVFATVKDPDIRSVSRRRPRSSSTSSLGISHLWRLSWGATAETRADRYHGLGDLEQYFRRMRAVEEVAN